MSSQKGNTSRHRPPKHKNNFAFKNDMHDTSGKSKAVNSLCVSNVCQRCKDCIEWKIKYKKYKPLTVPRKCIKCDQKKVKFAYHMVCSDCAVANGICAKCSKAKEVIGEPELTVSDKQREENYLREELKYMRVREKKTFLRQVERGDKVLDEIKPGDKENHNIGSDEDDGDDDDDDDDDDEYGSGASEDE